MIRVRRPEDLDHVPSQSMRELLRQRLADLQVAFGDYDATEYGWFVVLEPGDDPDDPAGMGISFSLVCGLNDGIPYGAEGFVAPFEWVADYGFCYEAVTVIGDAGDFVSVLVPKLRGIDERLLAICHELSTPSDLGRASP